MERNNWRITQVSNTNEKVCLEGVSGSNYSHHYGMSSALGATKSDLPTDNVPAGSDAFDYTTRIVYFYDGVGWN